MCFGHNFSLFGNSNYKILAKINKCALSLLKQQVIQKLFVNVRQRKPARYMTNKTFTQVFWQIAFSLSNFREHEIGRM